MSYEELFEEAQEKLSKAVELSSEDAYEVLAEFQAQLDPGSPLWVWFAQEMSKVLEAKNDSIVLIRISLTSVMARDTWMGQANELQDRIVSLIPESAFRAVQVEQIGMGWSLEADPGLQEEVE